MAKILISPLGTGMQGKDENEREYRDALYRFDGTGNQYKTPFIAAAIAQEFEVDRIIFIGTTHSMWEEVYRYFSELGGILEEKTYFQLVAYVDKKGKEKEPPTSWLGGVNEAVDHYLKEIHGAAGGTECVCLQYGLNEAELWKNFGTFMTITETFQAEDEIYLDITHSFRSIPLFMYLMMDFVQTLEYKRIRMKGLFYGMLEVSNEKGYAPVIDLKPFFDISKWIQATYSFVNYGNGYLIADLVEDEKIKQKLKGVTDAMQINYLVDLRKQVMKLSSMLEKQSPENMGMLQYMMPVIGPFINRLKSAKTDEDFQLEVSKWFYDNRMYSNAYICLFESITSKLCALYGLDINVEQNKDSMKALLFNPKHGQKHPVLQELWAVADNVNRIRIQVAHASAPKKVGNKKNAGSVEDAIKAWEPSYRQIYKIFRENQLSDLPKMIPLKSINQNKR